MENSKLELKPPANTHICIYIGSKQTHTALIRGKQTRKTRDANEKHLRKYKYWMVRLGKSEGQ